jgi:hypothetical protein
MSNVIERIKACGNVISEFDNYYKLAEINPSACKDRLRGYFGERHGDWNKANEQAETSMLLLDAMSKREIGFKEVLKSEKSLQHDELPVQFPA